MKTNQNVNILIIICDQLSAQALPVYGNAYAAAEKTTPNINSIFQNGVYFDRAYSNCPLCLPSRASFWSGLYPHQTGVLSNGREFENQKIETSVPTVGSEFKRAGYKPFYFGKRHDGGALHGFDLFPVEQADPEEIHTAWPVHVDTRQDRSTTEQAVRFLETYTEEDPYLSVVSLNNPHDICSWIGTFQGDTDLINPECDLPPLPPNLYLTDEQFNQLPLPVQYICCAHNRQAQISEWTEEKIRHYLCAYHHYIRRVDSEIGLVLKALRSRSDAGSTMIVFTADHGDSMCGKWMATKHTSFYDETTRIPLVFSGAGINNHNGKHNSSSGFEDSRAVHSLVSLLDLFPTLCDYAGLDSPRGLFGKSLLPLLQQTDSAEVHDYIISQWHTEWGFTIEPGRMLRTDKYKYIRYLEGDGEELYDLDNDPFEMTNLAGNHDFAEVLDRHRLLLSNYIKETGDNFTSLEWKADKQWRKHKPGYRNHRGIAAPMTKEWR